jgi:hypothetical protein
MVACVAERPDEAALTPRCGGESRSADQRWAVFPGFGRVWPSTSTSVSRTLSPTVSVLLFTSFFTTTRARFSTTGGRYRTR